MKGRLTTAELAESDIDTVLIAGIDLYGRLIGKRVPTRIFLANIDEGLHVCTCVYAWDASQRMDKLVVDYAGGHTGWHDFRLQPDLGTLRRASWLESTAIVIADSVDEHTGEMVPIAPRTILRKQIDKLEADGHTVYAATELEFHLYRGTPDTLRRSGYRDLEPTTLVPSDYTITAGNAMEPFFRKVRTALEESAIPVEVSQVEYGLGQWEINLEYGTALEMADRHVLFKQVVHDVAAAEGLTATFMARPSTDGMGSSCHIHASMRSDDTFPFHDESAENTASAELLHAVGGVLEHCPELMLFYTPTINSMRRTRASHDFSGNGLTWGFDNRTTTCRLITGAPSANRLEMRLPGADANPYLALAAVLASMNDGLTRKLDPGAPVRRDGYSDTDTLEKVKQQPLPGTLDEAARALEASEFALAAFGAEVVSHYAAVAKDEWDSFMSAVTDWERERYLDNI
ncbi:glutamine synthetase family protein [Rhodococcus qingshengii]|uniref:glutamine synthetase family protein n=1 Tax=Rhodococcus qingshengii TaxID=334542 RepID=UPI0009F388E7|nr:glutamine synthetase family protein [Rhodococcus qingshengii]